MSKSFRSEKRLKQDAKKLSKETGISQSKALDQIARDAGYSAWVDLSRSIHEGKLEYKVTDKQAELFPVDKYKSDIASEINDVLVREHQNKLELTSRGMDFAIFEPTEVGLNKSIIDSTQSVGSLFEVTGIHDYSSQGQGPENKIILEAVFLTEDEEKHTSVSLYRPNTKNGDPRMWFRKLGEYVSAGDKVAIIVFDRKPYLINLSSLNLKVLVADELTCVSKLFRSYLSKSNAIAEELLDKLKVLAKKGALKAITKGSTAIGMTIEDALGIPANSSKKPDYKGIELKSARDIISRSTLYGQVADWKISPLKSSREILKNFGYKRNGAFRLYCTVSAKKENSQGLKLEVRDNGGLLVETQKEFGDVAYWPEKLLRDRLLEKHAETFWIHAESTKKDGIEYFQLKSVVHTKAPSQGQLMPLIESGVITLDHLIKRVELPKPKLTEKGPLFKINKKDLSLLFTDPINYSLVE